MYPWGYMYPRLGTPALDDQTLQHSSTQSQSKMRLLCSKNKDEYKHSDCIKARMHTLLRLSASLEKQLHIFFLTRPQR